MPHVRCLKNIGVASVLNEKWETSCDEMNEDVSAAPVSSLQVYWCNGAQICSPHDREILCCVEEQLEPWSASCWEEELVETSSLRTDPLADISRSYMEELTSLCFHR